MCLFLLGANAQKTVYVQGVPRQMSAAQAQKVMKADEATSTLDVSKVKYFVGEGSNTSYLILEWKDGKGADKLVWGYKWDDADAATGYDMLSAVAKADPRFYMLVYEGTQYGSALGGFGFDLNGNQQNGVLKSGSETEITPDENGRVLTTQYDFDDYTPIDSTDHWRSGWYSNGYWSYWVASSTTESLGYSGLGASSRKLADGSVDGWVFSPFTGTSPASVNYYFYVPEPVTGVALPDEITLPLSDAGYVPVILGATGLTPTYYSWTVKNEKNANDKTIISGIKSSKSNINGAVTFTGKLGEVYVTNKVTINKKIYTSNTCKVTVVAPEKPLTALSFAEQEVNVLGLKKKYTNTLTLTPSDATYTAVTYTSSNTNVATVSATGEVTTKSGGETEITATSAYDPTVTATYKLTVTVEKPVTEIQLDDIELEVRDIYCPTVTILPEDAEYPKVSYKIEDTSIASFYNANIVGHKVGTTNMTVTADDGMGASKTVKITVKEQDRTPYEGYQDGTFILNEAWFGHENGDMNFLTADNELMYRVYERENAGEAFGATPSSGIVYGGKMYVMSKQDVDGGDLSTNGGGRLVVFDAKTLKKIAGFASIGGGDGRSVVGVNPDKVYLGTTAGIFTFDVKNMALGNLIEGTAGGSSYSGQIGDMLKAGKYVFAAKQSTGTIVIDTETDEVVKTIENSDIQGITQAYDGKVWLGSTSKIERLNPESLEIDSTVTLPSGVSVDCSWGAWRPTPFCASRTKNVLYWNGMSGWNNSPDYYRYEIGTDISDIKPIFTLTGMAGTDETKTQTPYGSVRYDDRTGNMIITTTQYGWGTNYEHNWVHLVDGTTGELKKSIKMKQYYWFPELPIFPDKYAPEFVNVGESVSIDKADAAYTIDLTDKVTDKDNLVYNITTTLEDAGDATVAVATFENGTLKIAPVAEGTTYVKLSAESNGVVTEKEIAVKVTDKTSGISEVAGSQGIYAQGGQLVINGYEGWRFMLYDMGGKLIKQFTATTNHVVAPAAAGNGVYILKGWTADRAVTVKVTL